MLEMINIAIRLPSGADIALSGPAISRTHTFLQKGVWKINEFS